jgi:hypothetical protein
LIATYEIVCLMDVDKYIRTFSLDDKKICLDDNEICLDDSIICLDDSMICLDDNEIAFKPAKSEYVTLRDV